MNKKLINLCNHLKSIAESNKLSPEELTALKKSAFSLHIVFEKNLMGEVDVRYNNLGKPLTSTQKNYLRKIGIYPSKKE